MKIAHKGKSQFCTLIVRLVFVVVVVTVVVSGVVVVGAVPTSGSAWPKHSIAVSRWPRRACLCLR